MNPHQSRRARQAAGPPAFLDACDVVGPPAAAEPCDLDANDESLALMRECFARFGDTFRVRSPTRGAWIWVIHHPDDVKRVLVANHRNYTKGIGLERVRVLLGNGIMTSEGDFWRRQRHMMQPAFHRRVIAECARPIAAENDALLMRWERAAASGESVDVTRDVSALTLSIILRLLFGRDLDALWARSGENPFALLTQDTNRDLRFAYRFRSLTGLVAELIARRRTQDPSEHCDFVALLMSARDKESGDAMSERELIDEIMTLVVAGHETTASALNSAWYLLARHPQAERRLHAEVDALPSSREPLGLEAAEALHWTRAICEETLRLYPPGWMLSRRSIGPDRLGGFELPAGTDIVLSPYLLHRHPRYWSEPEEFRPERFASTQEPDRPRFAYLPFAAGPRHCIGESLAMFEMVVHLARVARRLRVRVAPDLRPNWEAQINLRTRTPIIARVETRA